GLGPADPLQASHAEPSFSPAIASVAPAVASGQKERGSGLVTVSRWSMVAAMWSAVRAGGRRRFPALLSALLPAAAGLLVAAFPSSSPQASETLTHVVARGHTLEAIANRYKVSVHSIVAANHLKDPKHLKVGDTLTIPGVVVVPPPASSKAKSGGDP